MGEDARHRGGSDAGRDERLTVADAAERLGVTKEAVRKRISRGTLLSDKDPDGTVRVYVPPSGTPSGTPSDVSGREELVEELRDRLRFVERQLEAERQAHAEARRIIGGLVQRIPELEAPSEAPDTRVTPSESVHGDTPFTAEQRAQETAQPQGTPRSWWRRMFGG